MRKENFETPETVDLFVEIGSGAVRLQATETHTTDVQIDGRSADDVTVTQNGRAIRIVGPKSRGFFGNDHRLDVQVSLPSGSDVTTRTGSAGVETRGTLGATDVEAGSGRVEGDAFTGSVTINTGSGSVRLAEVTDEVRIKTGSGAVDLGGAASCAISTGSGSVHLGSVSGAAAVKTGSGSLSIDRAGTETSFKTGSGHLAVGEVRSGQVNVKGASGDVTIGVPEGTPVWADANAVSGVVRNEMPGTGAPQEGQPHVELHVTTVSGDITVCPA